MLESWNQNHYTNGMAPFLKIMGWQVAKVCFKAFCSYQTLQGAYAKGLLTDSQLFLLLIQLLDQQWFQTLDSLSQDLQLRYSSDININLTNAVNYTCIWICRYVYQSKHVQYRHCYCWGKPLFSNCCHRCCDSCMKLYWSGILVHWKGQLP